MRFLNAWVRPPMSMSRPPSSFHSLRALFRSSADFPISPPIALVRSVHIFVASGRLPRMISKVSVQPVPAAAASVSSIIENVLTSVAAA